MRKVIDFNDDWLFCKTKEIPKVLPTSYASVTIPHTWNAKDGQDGGNDYYRGTCTYVKEFKRPNTNKNECVFLEFQGVAMTAEIYLNGQKITKHAGGYSTFRAELTDYLDENNLLVVTVDNSKNEMVYPQKADFTFYGGIYRDVKLILVPEQHFELIKDGTPGIKITSNIENIGAKITVETWLNSKHNVRYTFYAPNDCGIDYWKGFKLEEISDKAEKLMEIVVESTINLDNGIICSKTEAIFEQVRLWDGIKDPYLYVVKAELLNIEGTEVLDTIVSKFGVREFEFDKEKGFFLNGNSYSLRGVARHQDRWEVGNALTMEMQEEDLDIIQEIGANTVRLAHYQHSQYFYDLCDESGLIVWAEIPYITQHMPKGRENTLSQMRELVTQCYNHPSIICWGLSNEITASGNVTEDMMENHRLLNDLCHKLDVTRPTTMAHVFMLETENPIIDIPDIGSYNLYFGWYLGELEQNEAFFDEYHQKYPERIIGFSEYGADANPKYQTDTPERSDYTETYQCIYHEHILKMIEERPYLWATHLWNLFDFAADGRDEGGKHGINQKGLVTIDRKIKKDAFYLYKAYWSKEPFIHICGKRYEKRVGETSQIKVYSNQSSISLWVDGVLIETKTGNRVFTFQMPISGEHTIEAITDLCKDKMKIQKVNKPYSQYQMLNKETIVNWFNKEELDVSCFSIEDTMGEIMSTSVGANLLTKIMDKASKSRGEVAQATEGNKNLQKMLSSMKLSSLLKQAGNAISSEEIRALNNELQKIKKKTEEKIRVSVESRIDEILKLEQGKQIFDEILPGMRQKIEGQDAVAGMNIRKLISYSKGAIPETVLEVMDSKLKALELYISPERDKEYSPDTPILLEASEVVAEETRDAIYPGRVWRDTNGVRIQAHGGALLYDNGTYYWYGENKNRTDGKNAVWTWGINAYESKDLYNWRPLGLIIEPDYKNEQCGLYPERHADRPHILKCDATGKYVCWIKQCDEEACFLILEAEAFTGPYVIVAENYRPFGKKVGDFDIYKEEDGKAYLFMDADHKGIVGMQLSEDYREVVKEVSRQYTGLHAPFCREAVAVFKHEKKYFMLTSGMSGYIPNKSDVAASDSITSTFTSIGNPHINDTSNASFNSQISQVFKIPDKNLYIAIADRWVPDYVVDARRADIVERFIGGHYEPEKYKVTLEEQQEFMNSPMLGSANTSIANYVWLPIIMDGGKPKIIWHDRWRIEDF